MGYRRGLGGQGGVKMGYYTAAVCQMNGEGWQDWRSGEGVEEPQMVIAIGRRHKTDGIR